MILNRFALMLIMLLSSTFTESNIYSLRPNDVIIFCVDVTSRHEIRSAVDCSLHASRREIYDHGMVYDDNRCHICRSNTTICGMLTEEVLLRGPHYTKGKLENIEQYSCWLTDLEQQHIWKILMDLHYLTCITIIIIAMNLSSTTCPLSSFPIWELWHG